QGDSFAMGLDTLTGETRWRQDRPRLANWTSPILLRGKTRKEDLVLLQCSTGLVAHDPASGKELWKHDQPGSLTIPSAAVSDGVVYLPANGLTALRPQPGSQAVEVLWDSNTLGSSSSSPVVYGGRVYSVDAAGILNCGNATDGQK